ncbi:MAG: glycosyltransferase family 39 protein [Gemmatimonadales bacterium]
MPALLARNQWPRWLPVLAIGGLSLTSSLICLRNDYSYDDIAIIFKSERAHSLASAWKVFALPYWSKPFEGLYRPLTTLSLAAQWVTGGGRPWVVHATSVVLYLACCLALYALARQLLPQAAAWVAAALFAVDPVHVEAIALGVNQAEIVVALLLISATSLYLRARAAGPLTPAGGAALVGLYTVACFTKEHAIVFPGLLIAAEMTVVVDPRPLRHRLRELRPLILVLLLAATLFMVARTLVLQDVVGTFTAEGLRDANLTQRALTMLAVVPRWTRLLLWPSHLQVDYTPREIDMATGWGADQTLGALLILLVVAVGLVAYRRKPVVTFGLLWVMIGLFPVSNVLVPTGIVMAERTLFLPSAGLLLALGTAVPWVRARIAEARPAIRLAAIGTFAVLLASASWFSAYRLTVYRNQFMLFYHMVEDAPLSYRAHWSYGDLLFNIGMNQAGEAHYRAAIALFPDGAIVYQGLADRYRLAGKCKPAMDLYQQALALRPAADDIRASLVACLLIEGRYQDARFQARLGRAGGANLENFSTFIRVADSALAAGAKPGTVSVMVTDTTGGR